MDMQADLGLFMVHIYLKTCFRMFWPISMDVPRNVGWYYWNSGYALEMDIASILKVVTLVFW